MYKAFTLGWIDFKNFDLAQVRNASPTPTHEEG